MSKQMNTEQAIEMMQKMGLQVVRVRNIGMEEAQELLREAGHIVNVIPVPSCWQDYCNSGEKPDNIPDRPDLVYLNKGWNGWHDWFEKFDCQCDDDCSDIDVDGE